MNEDQKKELELITMVEQVLSEQEEYFNRKRKNANAGEQLQKCKELEKKLKNYCADRRKALTGIQSTLF